MNPLESLYAGEKTATTLGRLVVIIWLFVVMVLNCSYTASLTSILTVEQLPFLVKGIESLATSDDRIGYLRGSLSEIYLTQELKIHISRLVPLNSPSEYEKALKDGPTNGGVAAIVDERAYVEIFLETRCEFGIIGQEFTKMGWGFVSIYIFIFFPVNLSFIYTNHSFFEELKFTKH